MPARFDHEKLEVYQTAISFVAWSETILQCGSVSGPVRTQLERPAVSIPLNIAEGNGKQGMRDRCRFLGIARGSAFECAACLDVLVAKKRRAAADLETGKDLLHRIVSMLTALIASVSDRVAESGEHYESSCSLECEDENEKENENE